MYKKKKKDEGVGLQKSKCIKSTLRVKLCVAVLFKLWRPFVQRVMQWFLKTAYRS